jgi:hypothetical protein
MLGTVRQELQAGLTDDEAAANGTALGAAVAEKLLGIRANDGRNAVVPYVPRSGVRAWVATPPAFLAATTGSLARITPFTMDRVDQFRPAGPPAFHSKRWVEDYVEVKTLGGHVAPHRTAEQTATALFWEPLAGTVWPASIRRMARD